ncbi:MAG TPA: hypothetical protein VE650_03815, partial [Acetobacteraceae bacterium]|nr:hypothetical protein [Acetobacteraceae bacterium]
MTRRLAWLAALGAALVALVATAASVSVPYGYGDLPEANTQVYVAATIAAGLVYAGAVALVRAGTIRHALPLVLGVAVILRVITFAIPPMLSSDIFRYVWDGRVQAAGINPYLYLPAAPELAFLRDHAPGWAGVYDHINRVDIAPTIYPPGAQGLFALLGRTWSSVWGVKFAMLAFDLIAIGAALKLLLAARQNLALVLIYAWNPLPPWEFGGAGHIDAAAVAFG